MTPKKRKAEGKKDTPPAKKAKGDGESKLKHSVNEVQYLMMNNMGLNTDM